MREKRHAKVAQEAIATRKWMLRPMHSGGNKY